MAKTITTQDGQTTTVPLRIQKHAQEIVDRLQGALDTGNTGLANRETARYARLVANLGYDPLA